MGVYWEEHVEMKSPEELMGYYDSREDEAVENYFDERNGVHNE